VPRDLDAPAIVIAHGAWADATSWREVIAVLQAQGLRVVAVQNPLTALVDDVGAVRRALDHQPHPVVLVGHDYGGTIITQTGLHQKVAALVYIAAYAPDVGESSADVQKDQASLPFIGRFTVDAGGFLYLAPEAVLEFLAHDLPATEAAVLAAAQRPIRASALVDRVTEAGWHARPAWYGVADADRMLAPALQREIARKINASVVTLRAGHLPFLSKPVETAGVILAAVDGIRRQWLTTLRRLPHPRDRE
jgi:pimeloyl-ACP methyl ester carboxylesterase